MKRIVLSSMLAVGVLGLTANGFAAEKVLAPVTGTGEVKTAGLFGLSLPFFGSSCPPNTSCGYSSYSGYGYRTPCYSGNCSNSYRYPNYGYSNCGPNGCYSSTPVMTYPATPVIYQQAPPSYTVPAPYNGYNNQGYMPYAPVNYGVPYGSRPASTTPGYNSSSGVNSPFYP